MENNNNQYSLINRERIFDNTFHVLRGGVINPTYYQKIEEKDKFIIIALDCEISSKDLPSDKNVFIYSYNLVLSGEIKLEGKNISIFSRKIVSNSSVLNVTGKSIEGFKVGDRANDGRNLGDDGETFDKSPEDGQDGGIITITCEELTNSITLISNGGNGGRGRDGGNGARGNKGSVGLDGDCYRKGQIGGKGGKGGNAGSGGTGSNGGDAGIIQVNICGNSVFQNLNCSAEIGLGGEGGEPGIPGEGGEGGEGGWNIICKRECEPTPGPRGFQFSYVENIYYNSLNADEKINYQTSASLSFNEEKILKSLVATGNLNKGASSAIDLSNIAFGCITVKEHANRQPNGQKGDKGLIGAKGKKGNTGNSKYLNSGTYNYKDCQKKISDLEFNSMSHGLVFLMVLHSLEVNYLNGNIDEVKEKLNWLLRVFQQKEAVHPIRQEEWEILNEKLDKYLNQISLGLDFYGHYLNYVPLVTLGKYKDYVERLLRLGKEIETRYTDYNTLSTSVNEKMNLLKKNLQSTTDQIQNLQDESDKMIIGRKINQDTILSLLDEIIRQEEFIKNSELEFRMAVQREAGCEFEEVLKTVFTIVSLGASIYGGIATIAGGFQTALEKGHVAKERVKALIGVRGGVKEISKAWKELKPYLNDDKDDIGKILLTDESYKDVLKPYMNMPEAQKLKRELDLYISLVNTRNKKILEISSIDIQIEKNTQEIKQILAEKDRIQSTISITNDPTLPECVMFMSSFLLKVKSQLIYALYNENRAFQYWSLNYNKINLDDQEVLRLEKFHFDLLDKEIQYMNFRGRASQSFKLSKEITERDFPTNFKNFKETGKFVLDIDIEKQNVFFSNWREITLSSINLIFHGVKAKDYISVAVVHGGCAKFKKNDGSIIEFTHRPRVTSIVHKMPYGAESAITPIENNLGSDDNKTFSYLSPFSQWIFFVLPEFNKNLDLSEIDKIEIIFSGHFLPVIV